MEITEIVNENGNIRFNTLYRFVEDTERSSLNKVVGGLKRTENKLENTLKLRLAGIEEDI